MSNLFRFRDHIGRLAILLGVALSILGTANGLSAQTVTITTPSLPNGVDGVSYPPQALSATGGTAPYTWLVSTGSLPTGLTLDSPNANISGTPTLADPNTPETSNFILQATDHSGTVSGTKSFTVIITPKLSITTASPLPSGAVSSVYNPLTLSATRGTAPYSWTLISGSLPSGLSLSGGVISGTPTVSGIFNFTVRAIDSSSPSQTATANLKISIPPLITSGGSSGALPNGAVGVAYSQTLTGSPGTTPFSWTVASGAVPSGLTLSGLGILSGNPTTSGTFNFTIGLTDSSSPPQTGTAPLSLTIQPALTVTTVSPLPLGIVGSFYSQSLASSGPSPVSWFLLLGSLPPGLNLATNGALTGSPSVPGPFDFTVQAIGGVPQQTVTQAFHIQINGALTITTLSTLANGVVSSPYSVSLAATGGLSPYTWTNPGPGMPPGLTLSTAGVLSGTPTTPGNFAFTVQLADSFTPTANLTTRTFSIAILNALTVLNTTLPNGAPGLAYSQTLSAAAGNIPYSWSVTSGSLPAGLSLSSAGVISGSPTTAGASNFTVRVSDSSAPVQTASQALTITVQSALSITTVSPLPPGIVGGFYSQTMAAVGPSPLTWSVSGGILAPGLSLATNGSLTGTPSIAGTFNFTIQAVSSNPQQTATQSVQIVINGALAMSTASALPNAVLSRSYSASLTAIGGLAPYSWASQGSLPPGLSLSSAGVLGGTPTSSGNFAFVGQVTDSSTPAQTVSRTFTIAVSTTLTIVTTSLPNGAVGLTYSQTLTAAAGTTPYSWQISAGSLPDGLSLSSSGKISGTPTSGSTFNFTVSVTDSDSSPQSTTQALTIIVQPAVVITTASQLPGGSAGVFYSQSIKASVSSGITWSVVSSDTPPGLTLTSNGTLSGTPATAGTYDFIIQAVAGTPQQTITKSFELVITSPLSIFTFATLPNATLSSPYSASLSATGGVQPYTWISRGSLPPGLTLTSAGVLSGTPSGGGNFAMTIQVSDSSSPPQTVSRVFSLGIASGATITTASLPDAIQSQAYSQQLQAVGVSPFTWVVTSGSLPSGLAMSASGLISGSPTVTGPATFQIMVTDSIGMTSSKSFTLQVDPPLPVLSANNLPASVGPTQLTPLSLSLAAPYPSALSGQLTLTFSSLAEVPGDDPMTQFSTGSRTVSFTIPANSTDAVFPSPTFVLTGTVAGTATLTANIQNGATNLTVGSFTIASTAPQITNVTAAFTSSGLDVHITGYAPTRRLTNIEFIFNLTVGGVTQSQTLSGSVDAVFAKWYTSAASVPFGSEFSYLQSFAISGGTASDIKSVTVRLTNPQGSTASAVVNISPP